MKSFVRVAFAVFQRTNLHCNPGTQVVNPITDFQYSAIDHVDVERKGTDERPKAYAFWHAVSPHC